MPSNPLLLAAALLASLAMPLAAQQSAPRTHDDSSLVYVVYVSRHGVRSPTGKAATYDAFATAPWPTWKVQPGYLTTHGYELMKLFGSYDRMDLAARGLFQGEGCADAGRITIHADSDERTRETGKALAEGMFPGCSVAVKANDEGVNDPLFHLPASKITPEMAARGAAAIQGRVGNDPANVAAAYHQGLADLDDVLKGCGAKGAARKRTSIFDVPADISTGTSDHVAEMRGPISTAGTLTENLLLEYTDGFDTKDVGWGCVDGAKLRSLIDLHTASFDLAQRTPAVAAPQASALLYAIGRSLQQAMTGKPVQGAEGKLGDKALFLIGHDTNLANLAGVLNVNWLFDGRRDDTPPGSALVFELWKDGTTASYSVRVYFTAQTLEQMRNAEPLSASKPPAKASVFVPACSEADGACKAPAMLHALESAIATTR